MAWVLNTASGDESLTPTPARLLLAGGAVALAAGAVAAADTIGPGGPLPVALGLIAPAIWLGLREAKTMVNNGPLASVGDGAQLLVTGLISGLLMLAGAVLMTVLRRPEPQPGEPSEPREPQPA